MAVGCSLHLLSALVLWSMQGGEAARQIALNTVSVDDVNDTLIINVSYTAGSQPRVFWAIPFLPRSGGIANIDFDQTDTFDNGEGVSTVRIRRDAAAAHNPKIFGRILMLKNDDCNLNVGFPPLGSLTARSPASQDFRGLALTLTERGVALDPGHRLVFGRRSHVKHIVAVVSSPELPNFRVGKAWVRHSRFDYSGGIPERKNDYGISGHRPGSVFSVADDWTGPGTQKRLEIKLYRMGHGRTNGILQLYNLNVDRRAEADSLVERIELKQNVYLVVKEGEEAVRRNTVYIDPDHSHLLSDFDMPIHLRVPSISVAAMGNPKPTLKLYRACSEVVPTEVEVEESRSESQYEVIHFFRFKNASEALQGSYTVVATSGLMETREVLSIGIPRRYM